jgi:hypothetical protein
VIGNGEVEYIPVKDVLSFLESKGFIKEYYSKFHPSWGDTLYIKK